MHSVVPVPFDPEIAPVLDARAASPRAPLTRESLPAVREGSAAMGRPAADVIGDRPVEWEDRVIPGPAGAGEIEVTILRPAGGGTGRPCFYNMHGGGLVMGNRHMNTARLVEDVLTYGCVAVNVEYRLAPENPGTGPAEDCYAGLVWTAEHAGELGIDANRIVVMGGSAGGLLSAAMALMSRDRGGPALAGQLLLVPMLDDRNETVSSYQYDGIGMWDRQTNVFCWDMVLGEKVGTGDVSPYAAPARAADLSNLAPACIDLGSAELLRDEAVTYASRIWAAGGQCELHVWGGGFHGFDIFAPASRLAHAALAARESWLRRILAAPQPGAVGGQDE